MAEFTPINTQEELDRVLASRLQRERDTVSRQFEGQIAERDKKITGYETQITDLNKRVEEMNGQAGRIQELETKVHEYETNSVKMRIAREAGLPAELADRLSGTDEETIRADAEALKKVFRGQNPAPMYRQSGEGGDGKDAALKNLLKKMRNE